MQRTIRHWQAFISSGLLCLMCMASSVRAAPPVLKTLQSTHTAGNDTLKSVAPGSGAMSVGIDLPRHLDLRLPEGGAPVSLAMIDSRRFASRRGAGAVEEAGPDAPLATSGQHARIEGHVEAFAHRFRREGLPVARLWENHAALVSLGLNGKGKPGIWLVQKVH
jgi:hypothetical protein